MLYVKITQSLYWCIGLGFNGTVLSLLWTIQTDLYSWDIPQFLGIMIMIPGKALYATKNKT